MENVIEMTREFANSRLNPYANLPSGFEAIKEKWGEMSAEDRQVFENRIVEKDADGYNHIYVDGPITDEIHKALYQEWFGVDVTISARQIKQELSQTTGNIMLHINSPGGSVFEAVEVYSALQGRQKNGDKVICSVDGLCASAAGMLLAVGDERQISDFGTVMLHFVLSGTFIAEYGFVEDLESAYEKLGNQIGQMKKLNAQFLKTFSEKFGKTEDEMRGYMKNETFFVGQEAVDEGFANKLIDSAEVDNAGDHGGKRKKKKMENESETPREFQMRMHEELKAAHGNYLFAV